MSLPLEVPMEFDVPDDGCSCNLITLEGPCKVEGVLVVGFDCWTTGGGEFRVRVMEGMPRDYKGIIGCDVSSGARVRNTRGKIRFGDKKYPLLKNSKPFVGVINQVGDLVGGRR